MSYSFQFSREYLSAKEIIRAISSRVERDPFVPLIEGAFDNQGPIWRTVHERSIGRCCSRSVYRGGQRQRAMLNMGVNGLANAFTDTGFRSTDGSDR